MELDNKNHFASSESKERFNVTVPKIKALHTRVSFVEEHLQRY